MEPRTFRVSELCQQALSFENYYLQLYRDYLLEQLRGDHPERQVFAARRLRDVLYHDSEILSALQTLQSAGELARAAADETLQIYANIQRQAI